jgi:hypothetical protein
VVVLVVAAYFAMWVALLLATHLLNGEWWIHLVTVAYGIAAACCGVVGWHLVRPNRGPSAEPAIDDDPRVTSTF